MVRQNRVDYIRSSSLNREIVLSTVLHVLVVLSAFIVLPTPEKISLPDYALPIDVITIDEFTRMTSQDPKPEIKTDQAEEIEKPPANIRQETAPPPPADNTDAMPLLGPKPASTPKPKEADSMPEPVNLVGDVVPLARPRPAKPERKPLLDTAAVQALLDKTPDLPEPTPPKPVADLPPGERMSLSEIDAFRAQIRACWSVPAGAKNAESLVVRVRVQLDTSGRPIAKKVINRAQLTDSFFLSAAESVLRAIERCQPYKMPPEKYESWREMELNFDPSKMLNG
ncbi:MAG: hypothetical protein CBC70_04565 [Alphaproteobacteria bacterium TMED110]|uniref:Energy transducer TonB n=1 Tax=PS1 clade bacterium TaxID=2175152 RepID=A0A368EJ89_9PROT|nr:hypothetical protein [Hyphomicrobiales bacterium]OUV48291.1 MAG: hypothetical protein CBC70_04565 [Alphaproteobacteria bacterium TMED110]RCL84473.1 MAG: hypothetical protein DBW64_03535 [PS1 clade bacterium]